MVAVAQLLPLHNAVDAPHESVNLTHHDNNKYYKLQKGHNGFMRFALIYCFPRTQLDNLC